MKPGLFYVSQFLRKNDEAELVHWLKDVHPLWEFRYSLKRTLPEGEVQRRLLRPVYWLGNWQFACLNYYRPPKGIKNRTVVAERFPPVLARICDAIEKQVRVKIARRDIPPGWKLNTCLINYYGIETKEGRRKDVARVGEHKDFEPGPVASLSLGDRALFQFVSSRGRGLPAEVVQQMWLEHGSLQAFAGEVWKTKLFHRVQRVERKRGLPFSLSVENFETRRINFTFRFVPEEHWVAFENLPSELKEDVMPYVTKLAEHSKFYQRLSLPLKS